jgi:SsrA-binding protein
MKIENKKAYFEYSIQEEFEAGIALLGAEVKSLKAGHASLEGSFVKMIGNTLSLVNAQIYPYSFARANSIDPRRSRKLLLHKKEILSLQSKLSASNLTIIPLCLYDKGPFIKLKIALAKGKKEFQKKEKIKKKDMQRDIERELRGKEPRSRN